ncbi:hypothetical protein B0H34DRAFT_798636 [Crassisporium funariophilum]|nr:hypothetical protein B0H34DRAFT_798636 [Crassisporium funariophilum]
MAQPTGLICLNAAVSALEDLQKDFGRGPNPRAAGMCLLKGLLEVEEDLPGNSTTEIAGLSAEPGAEDGPRGSSVGPSTHELDSDKEESGQQQRKQASEDAKKSKPIKDLVNMTFKQLMGVDSLEPKKLPEYPHQIGRTNEHWPKDPETKNPFLRFDWKKAAAKGSNKTNLDKVFRNIWAQGAQQYKPAEKFLSQISDEHLKQKIAEKYNYMAREWTKLKKEQEAKEERQRRIKELEEEADQVAQDQKVLNRAQKNSRAKAVLNARIQKRTKLQYTDPKYDLAFILDAMSDYKDDPDQDADAPTVYLCPIIKAIWLVLKLYEEVDAIADPAPDKEKAIKAQKLGPPKKDSEPPVKPELLEANPHWFSGRVAISGIAWGDSEDPEEDEGKAGEKQKASAHISGEAKKRKRPTSSKVKEELEKAGHTLEKLTGGGEIDAMFNE